MGEVRSFLEDVVRLVSARGWERVSAGEGFSVFEEGAQYAVGTEPAAALAESEHVVVAWYYSEEKLAWVRSQCERGRGLAHMRLGRRPGTWHVPPEFGFARYVVFRTPGGATAPGLWRMKQAGYRVFTGRGWRVGRKQGQVGGPTSAWLESRSTASGPSEASASSKNCDGI